MTQSVKLWKCPECGDLDDELSSCLHPDENGSVQPVSREQVTLLPLELVEPLVRALGEVVQKLTEATPNPSPVPLQWEWVEVAGAKRTAREALDHLLAQAPELVENLDKNEAA